MSVRRSRSRRDDALARLHNRVDALSGKRPCASLLTMIGVLNRCPGPCARCAGLAEDHAAAAPEREEARRQYDLAHPPKKAPTPAPRPLDVDELEDGE